MSTSLAWDERYAGGDFQFGEAPNLFLLSQAYRLRRGMRALAAGDGEGRNGVWLAEQGLDATLVDWSAVGLGKARGLAQRRGTPVTTITADLALWDWPAARFDLIAWIFVHLPPADRAMACAGGSFFTKIGPCQSVASRSSSIFTIISSGPSQSGCRQGLR